VSIRVPAHRAEAARAEWIDRFPAGFEETERPGEVELAAYVDRVPPGLERADVLAVEEGWEERWRSFHRPARVGPLWIGPPWETASPDAVPVVIDPGRAFGTGAHATTRLCLELLLSLDRGSLLDVGCGSGVLSVAAAMLGFGPALAVDIDPLAVEATAANATANGVEVQVASADALVDPLPATDVAVVNIALGPVELVGRRVPAPLLVTSGYLDSEAPDLPNRRLLSRRTLDGWAAELHGPE